MSDAREVWRKSHGFTKEALDFFARDLEFLIDDPRFTDPPETLPANVEFIWKYLLALEGEVIRLMSAGPPYVPKVESLDGAFCLSQVHAYFPPRWIEFLKRWGMPDSQLTGELLTDWEPRIAEGIPLGNGNLFSYHPWALSEPAWTLLVPSYLTLLIDPDVKAPFASTPARIEVTDADSLSFALAGDWGTGSFVDGGAGLCPADAIMQQIVALDVDYTVHLGDVYPVGRRPFYDYFLMNWKPGRRGAFALNSNHDMYAWGHGLFEQALQHATFALQRGTTYFSLEFGEWMVVGLDCAYHDTSPMFFRGTISDPDQKAFLQEIAQQVERKGQRIFLMTHYNPINLAGTETNSLWDEIVADDALGRAPDVWYWGHEHVGTVYSSSSVAGPRTLARCMGHGGIPLAVSDELREHTGEGKPIDCYANTPYPEDDPAYRGRVMNGFATVTLTKDGGLSERFLNQDGSDMCA